MELTRDLLDQVCWARARPTPTTQRLDVPSNALALYGGLETLQRLPGMGGGEDLSLPLMATCELLGVAGRADNARRALLTMGEALRGVGYVQGVRVVGSGRDAQLEVTGIGPDPDLVALLRREGVSRRSAVDFIRQHGEIGVRQCLTRARQVKDETVARGRSVHDWTKLLCSVLHHPERYDAFSTPLTAPAPTVQPVTSKAPLPAPDEETTVSVVPVDSGGGGGP